MLSHLSISNYTVITDLEISFSSGLTVVTGETGAGKSIMIDALGLCLGDRADPKSIRPGCERAEIHALFDLADASDARDWLSERDLDNGDELLLRRVVNADGRSRAYINGRPSTLQDCSELGEQLVDIQGQHAHQSLLRRPQQRVMLDEFAGADTGPVSDLALRWRDASARLQRLREQQGDAADREQLLRYQLQELDTLALGGNELSALEEEQRSLENAEDIQAQASRAGELSEQAADDTNRALAALDPRLHSGKRIDNIREMLGSAAIQLDEARSELDAYLADRESNPERLSEVADRLELIYAQARKHRVMPEQLSALHRQLRDELADLDSSDASLEALEAEVTTLLAQWQEAAHHLSTERATAAREMQKSVARLLKSLAMDGCQFTVALAPHASADPHPQGSEDVEFLVSTNPGAEPQSLGKVASGGELSRISLAIQVASAGKSTIPCMIFDEVDVGIGGAVAEVVGKLLASLTDHAQVLCVTHHAQVASQGNQHLLVEKRGDRKQVVSSLRLLDEEERILEIARMLGGVKITEQSRAHAREMLASAS